MLCLSSKREAQVYSQVSNKSEKGLDTTYKSPPLTLIFLITCVENMKIIFTI